MYEFKIRAAQADREGYFHTRWDLATPVSVTASNKASALTKARDLLGRPNPGRYWAFQVDEVKEVSNA